MNKLEIFKKKLIYRSNYRGTKEMDILLSQFVKKHINEFNEIQLVELDKFSTYPLAHSLSETLSHNITLVLERAKSVPLLESPPPQPKRRLAKRMAETRCLREFIPK